THGKPLRGTSWRDSGIDAIGWMNTVKTLRPTGPRVGTLRGSSRAPGKVKYPWFTRQYFSTTRHRAKTLTNSGVAFEACTQSFGTHTPRKRLEDRLLAATRFSAG